MELLELETEDESDSKCGICGDPHRCEECTQFKFSRHVEDTPILSRARLSIPASLKIENMSDGSATVIALEVIAVGTRFGPFEAKKIFTLEPSIVFPLRLFQGDDYFKEYYLDTSNEFECNWLYFVQPAGSLEEQNLVCYEDGNRVYYLSIREIAVGEHLKVWYSEHYASKMCKELLKTEVVVTKNPEKNIDVNELVKGQQNIPDRKVWICKFCGKQDNKVIDFALHILEHYTLQMRKVCEICKEAFKTRQNLKKHIRITHYNEKNLADKIILDSKKYGEIRKVAESKADVMGGPLLNNVGADNFENTNALLEHMMMPNFDMEQGNVGLDDENLNLGVDGLLNANFELNIEETGDKFVCDICLKSFYKLRLLITHIVLHTGKYTCNKCLRVFARKENYDCHSCQTPSLRKCPQCSSVFPNQKYLTRHILRTHNSQFKCTAQCKRSFSSQKTLDDHACKTSYVCNVCEKHFNNSRNLSRHKKTHNAKEVVVKVTICEICSKQCGNVKLLMQHMKTHTKGFECEICSRKFARVANYRDHINWHNNAKPHECLKCQQRFTSKKNLNSHMNMHENKFTHTCTECPQKFRQKSNLSKHINRVHRRECPNCQQQFSDLDLLKKHMSVHLEKFYKCPICKTALKLRSSLLRHIKKKHPQSDVDLAKIQSSSLENTDNNNLLNLSEDSGASDKGKDHSLDNEDIVDLLNLKENTMQDIDSNLDYIVNSYDPNFSQLEKDKGLDVADTVLDFNSLEMDFERNFNMDHTIVNQEVCLSMPELTQMEQNITLGENAYILENGTIVEPREQGQVVLYFLDSKEPKV